MFISTVAHLHARIFYGKIIATGGGGRERSNASSQTQQLLQRDVSSSTASIGTPDYQRQHSKRASRIRRVVSFFSSFSSLLCLTFLFTPKRLDPLSAYAFKYLSSIAAASASASSPSSSDPALFFLDRRVSPDSAASRLRFRSFFGLTHLFGSL